MTNINISGAFDSFKILLTNMLEVAVQCQDIKPEKKAKDICQLKKR